MSEQSATRRLAAILAIDMVGYSRLVEANEEGTLARHKNHRKELIDPKIAEHHGRIVKSTGDGLLVEFPSVVDAVRCAVSVQLAIPEREAEVTEGQQIAYRIGINLGDIVLDDGDIFGDGVNIAARLEGLAEPGGICVSRTVVNHVKGKVNSRFEDLGENTVKNIAQPIHVYRVLMEPEAVGTAVASEHKYWRWLITAAAVVVVLAGGVIWWQPWAPAMEPASIERMAFPLPDQPSIAVLPFVNMSGDPSQEHFADGITEDIITDLSRLPNLFVIARNSSFSYKDKSVKVQQVAEELGVRYVMEGSIQKTKDKVRVTVQLVDAISGYHVWAERYDRTLNDIFVVQDEITQNVAANLVGYGGRLTKAQLETAKRKPPGSLQAYDNYLLGSFHKHRFTQDDNAKARQYYERAIQLDPDLARAYLGLAWTHQHDVWLGWSQSPDESLAAFKMNAQRAVELDELDGEAHLALGLAFFIEGDADRGTAEYDQALALGPNNADVLAILGWNLPQALGQSEKAVELVERAMRLNPHYPDWYRHALGYAEYHVGRYEDAARVLRTVENPTVETALYLAMSTAELGQKEAAAKAVQEVLHLYPEFSAQRYMQNGGYRDPVVKSELLDGVRKAGLPE
ncbi:MAG: adenylate/guanylate cyclase domain-containing protein [Kiloniellales bacterium]|nr:adenylate/guanylate cyclase domain-containing protein [Kiloniellales bacterium]